MSERHGSHRWLTTTPIWAIFLILTTIISLAILVGRDLSEGIPYQVAYSAVVGEGVCFIAMVLIIAIILQREPVYIPRWVSSETAHMALSFMSLAVGMDVCFNTIAGRSGYWMDFYHDIVVFPLILYFGVTLLPIIWFNGKPVEKKAVIYLVLLWIGCFAFDLVFHRINQFMWLFHQGVHLVR